MRVSAIERSDSSPRPNGDQDINTDLGFGSVVASQSRRRLLNRDGTFNVRREGLRFFESLSAYHYLLTITWTKFLACIIALYIIGNGLFATIYLMLGPGALSASEHMDVPHRFSQAFFFSVHTLGTIGYGNVAPMTFAANVVVTIEALASLVGFALVAGIVFARFSRPVACIRFSDQAVVAPYRDGKAVMFRIVNQRSNQIVDLEAKVLFARRKSGSTDGGRQFIPLKLEREKVVFFPLSWTIVHPIDETSPLFGATRDGLAATDAEFLILLNGFDETFSQIVHARSSYTAAEIVWGARFASMFEPRDDEGVLSVDIRKLNDLERV